MNRTTTVPNERKSVENLRTVKLCPNASVQSAPQQYCRTAMATVNGVCWMTPNFASVHAPNAKSQSSSNGKLPRGLTMTTATANTATNAAIASRSCRVTRVLSPARAGPLLRDILV